jgi:hypothetical protein
MKKFGAFQLMIAVVLALVVVVGAWSPARAQDTGQDQDQNPLAPGFKNDIFKGQHGIYAAGGLNPDRVSVSTDDLGIEGKGFGQIRLARNPVTIDVSNFSMPLTYVYFNLWPWETRAYRNGDLKIFYKNANGGWSVCSPSFEVDKNLESDRTRIACVVPLGATTFGIGTDNPDAVSSILP